MHILYFHQHFSTPRGAVGTRSYEMAQALIRNGHSVTMVCGSYTQGETGIDVDFSRGRRRGVVDGIDVIELDLDYSNNLGFLRRISVFINFAFRSIWIALMEPCDIVVATSTPLTAGIPGIFARWLRGKYFVFEVRDLWPELPRAMGVIKSKPLLYMMSILESLSYSAANRLISLSPGISDGIQNSGVAKSRIAMIPNGCDTLLFSRPETGFSLPETFPRQGFVAIFAGTHGQANGLDVVLEAAAVLKRSKRRDISIVLVGDGREKQRLVESARSIELDNIIFLKPMPKEDLVYLLRSADVGLQILRNVPAFYYGTSPNKFFDYIASGLPVLNNYPGWLAETIIEYDCGLVVAPEDPDAIANALIKLADDVNEAERKGARALSMAQECFSRELLSEKWVSWVTSEFQ